MYPDGSIRHQFGGNYQVNRKLIRTTLAEVKGKAREVPPRQEPQADRGSK
jgi:hypothetical protein